MASLTLAILAAGRSSRFGRLKTLEPVGPSGEALFEYAIRDAVRVGCERVVFVTSKSGTAPIMERAQASVASSVALDFAVQTTRDVPVEHLELRGRRKPWGTGHALRALREKIDTPFLLVNADDYYGARAIESFGAQVLAAMAGGGGAHFVGAYELARTGLARSSGVNRGILTASASAAGSPGKAAAAAAPSFLERLEEVYDIRLTDTGIVGRDDRGTARNLAPDTPCSMNLWAFTPSIFEHLEAAFTAFLADIRVERPAGPAATEALHESEFLLSETIGHLAAKGTVRVQLLPIDRSTAGLTYPSDSPTVASALRDAVAAGDYPGSLRD